MNLYGLCYLAVWAMVSLGLWRKGIQNAFPSTCWVVCMYCCGIQLGEDFKRPPFTCWVMQWHTTQDMKGKSSRCLGNPWCQHVWLIDSSNEPNEPLWKTWWSVGDCMDQAHGCRLSPGLCQSHTWLVYVCVMRRDYSYISILWWYQPSPQDFPPSLPIKLSFIQLAFSRIAFSASFVIFRMKTVHLYYFFIGYQGRRDMRSFLLQQECRIKKILSWKISTFKQLLWTMFSWL